MSRLSRLARAAARRENYRWDLLCDSLNGRGVPNLDEALLVLEVAPLHQSLVSLLEADLVEELCPRGQ